MEMEPGLVGDHPGEKRRLDRVRSVTRAVAVPRAQILLLWLACGFALERFTGRVTDWFVMTDELLYERLAISVARSGSPLPEIHGRLVSSLDQLYPILVAVFFRHGTVHADLFGAHVFGAFLMSSVCIPAYLLARDVGVRRWLALTAGFLSVGVPWILYSAFLLTEVAAYPAFVWALLGIERCIARPSARNDALALVGLAVAFLARTQFVVLLLVPPLALVVFELGRHRRLPSLRTHAVLAVAYSLAAAVCLVLLGLGRLGSLLGAYRTTASGSLLPADTGRSLLQHLATLALGIGIVPAVVGGAWLLSRATRAQATVERQAFACTGLLAIVLVTIEATVFDLRLGVGLAVYDRYLFYLAPVLIIATLCALAERPVPTVALVPAAALLAAGFALDALPGFQWSRLSTLNPDSPVAGLYRPLVHLFGSLGAMRAALALLTLVLAGVFAAGARLLRPAHLTVVVVASMLVSIPLAAWYDVHRLVTSLDTAHRPLTGAGNGTSAFAWVDAAVGTGAQVTEVPYQVSTDYLVNQLYWRDLEFWNKSVERDAEYPSTDVYAYTGGAFPKLRLSFDPVTGSSRISATPYVVQSVTESRFQIAGNVQQVNGGAMLIDAATPWRLAWATRGPYVDGWMKPHVPARIRVYATPGQARPRTYYVSLQFRAPENVPRRPFVVRSNLEVSRQTATTGETTFVNAFPVCVPPGRYATVEVTASGSSAIPGDLAGTYEQSLGTRRGSIYLADTSVSDNVGKVC